MQGEQGGQSLPVQGEQSCLCRVSRVGGLGAQQVDMDVPGAGPKPLGPQNGIFPSK